MATQAIGLGVSFGLNALGRALTPSQKTFNRQEVGRADNIAVRRTGQGWSLDRVYGKYKVQGCPIFWALDKINVQETSTSSETQGGKGGGGQTTVTETVTNKKFGTFAFAVCDGPVAEIRRIEFNDLVVYNSAAESAGGVDATTYMLDNHLEIYLGTESQPASLTISSYSDPERVKFPYLCYCVIKDYPLEQFGDELPGTINVTVYGTEDNVNTVLLDVGERCGLTPNVDLVVGTLGTLPLSGKLKQDGSSAKSFIEEVMQRYFLVSYLGDNGEIVFAKQENDDTPIDIDYEDLGAINFGNDPNEPFTESILDPQDLPSQVTLNYTNINDAYNGGSATWIKPSSTHFRPESLSSNLALTPDQATEFCWRYLWQVWNQDRDFSFKLLPEKALLFNPGDKLNIPLAPGQNPVTFQVTEIQTGADFSAEIKAIPYNGEAFSTTPSVPKFVSVTVTGSTIQLSPNLTAQPVISDGITVYEEGTDYTVDLVTGEITLITIPADTALNIDYESEPDPTENDADSNGELPFYGEPIVTILDTPRVNNSDPPSLYLALEPDPTYGTVGNTAFYGRLDGSSYVLIGSALSATTTGTLNNPLPLASGIDTVNTVSVTLDRGILDPLTLTQFNNNELIILINDEQIGVKDSVLTAPLTYDISYFKRGHNGTIPASHSAGAKITVLNGPGKVIRINGDAVNIGKVLDIKAIPQGQSLDTITAVYSETIEGLYFKPYAPTDATATINQSSNISISFTANNTGLSPLSPQSFEIEVYDGVTLVRTISASSIPVEYLASEQITDFGSVQSSLDLVIYQLSSEYGRGYPLAVTVVPAPVVELPTISTFSPLQGDIGAAISIYGEGFTGATSAAIDGVNLTGFIVVNDTTITGVVAELTTTGKVSVTNSAGTTESIGDFVIFSGTVDWIDIEGDPYTNVNLTEILDRSWKYTITLTDLTVPSIGGTVDVTVGDARYYLPGNFPIIVSTSSNIAQFNLVAKTGNILTLERQAMHTASTGFFAAGAYLYPAIEVNQVVNIVSDLGLDLLEGRVTNLENQFPIQWGDIEGNLSSQSDLTTALNAKENLITSGTTSQYWRGDKSWQTLNKTAVGLGNVDNTSDADKPISTATQTALNAKFNNPSGTTSQYIRGDGSLATFPSFTKAKNIESISATKTLSLSDSYFQFLTPTVASVIVKLPAVGSGYFECEIANMTNTNLINVQENDGTAVITLGNTGDAVESIYCYWDGATWQVWQRSFY